MRWKWDPTLNLRIAAFIFLGVLADKLGVVILRGQQMATTGLSIKWELDDEPLPRRGEWFSVIDTTETPVALIEVLDVGVVRLGDVDITVAREEGEGLESVRDWRGAHGAVWPGYAAKCLPRRDAADGTQTHGPTIVRTPLRPLRLTAPEPPHSTRGSASSPSAALKYSAAKSGFSRSSRPMDSS